MSIFSAVRVNIELKIIQLYIMEQLGYKDQSMCLNNFQKITIRYVDSYIA